MYFVIIGKDPKRHTFVDASVDENSQRELLNALRESRWTVDLYGYAGEWTTATSSNVRTLLMSNHQTARDALQQLGITPVN